MSFTDKVIIVTGAASGIGAHTAKHLAKLGGKLCLVDRDEEPLKSVFAEIATSGSLVRPLVILADVTKDTERIIDDAVNHFGKLDVLINSAGIYKTDSVLSFSITQFDEMLNVNVKAAAILTSLAVPHLEKTKGNIVNISSAAGLKPVPSTLSYCISKAALDQFTKCTALDLASKGVRVNAINPAWVRTPLFEKTGKNAEEIEKTIADGLDLHPIGRIGEPRDISEAVAYLASDSASFITGVLFPVDGGYLLK